MSNVKFQKLHPSNMCLSSEYLDKLYRKRYTSTRSGTYLIAPQLLLKTVAKPMSIKTKAQFEDLFPERQPMKSCKIGFKFAGCCPVALKKTSVSSMEIEPTDDNLESFNSKVVICRRRLLKSVMDHKMIASYYDIRQMLV